MTRWATALELAGLPGLDPSERITRTLLIAQGVPARPRVQARGRPPLEFDCEHLPEPARAAWAERAEHGTVYATRARARDGSARDGKGRPSLLTPEIEQVILAILGHRQSKSGEFLRDAVSRQLGLPAHTLPDGRTFRRWAASIREQHASALMSIHDPEGFRARRRAAFGSMSASCQFANAEWQADGTKSDVTLVDGRWTIMGLLDVWTRRTMFSVAQAEDTAAFKALLRRAILAWGWPALIKVDKGSAFISQDTTLTLEQLGIPSICVMYGYPGLGKTMALGYCLARFDGVVITASSLETPTEILRTIGRELGLSLPHSAPRARMLPMVIDELRRQERPVLVDEFDRIVQRSDPDKSIGLIELFRDLVDRARVPMLVAGEERLPYKLEKFTRFFDRVLAWVPAVPLDMGDAAELQRLYCPEIEVEPGALAHILERTQGNWPCVMQG